MTTDPAPAERPAFTSVSIYNDSSGLVSFWYASEWQLYAAPTVLPAITLTPDPRDPDTHLAITVHDLGAPLKLKEHAMIVQGVRDGLAQLDGCIVESLTELRDGGRWGVEWQCTFLASGGERCRRRGRIFFSDRYQYAIVLQGSTEARYAYWQGMFEWTMLTVGTAPFSMTGWQAAAEEQDTGGAQKIA